MFIVPHHYKPILLNDISRAFLYMASARLASLQLMHLHYVSNECERWEHFRVYDVPYVVVFVFVCSTMYVLWMHLLMGNYDFKLQLL